MPGGRSEQGVWPLRVPKLEKHLLKENGQIVKDAKGLPVVVYKDVVFQSLSDQNEYLARNGLARMMDGEADSTVNEDSTHSVFTNGELPPAPSEKALTLASNIFFTEDPKAISKEITGRDFEDPNPVEQIRNDLLAAV